jgi:hypothetical protein
MYTPPSSSTAKELEMPSPVSVDITSPLRRSSVPTTPAVEANQTRSLQSGSAETILSPGGTAALRS